MSSMKSKIQQRDTTRNLLEQQQSKITMTPNADEDAECRELSAIAGRNGKCMATLEEWQFRTILNILLHTT